MTPERLVAEIYAGGPSASTQIVRDFLSAALRERDARWRDAVMAFAGPALEILWCGACHSDKKMLECTCPEGAPLRALLEEAGK